MDPEFPSSLTKAVCIRENYPNIVEVRIYTDTGNKMARTSSVIVLFFKKGKHFR
jgi:hypothetical protein